MFEIFLFINPIGIYCYDIERRIQRAIDELDIEVSYHLVPIANVHIVQDDMIRRKRNAQKLCQFSFYTLITNKALEYYHAIRFTNGNKKARDFLLELQKQLNENTIDHNYSDLFSTAINNLKINPKSIQSLKNSNYIKESIKQDQELAAKWDVKKTPTTVIFNENDASQTGMLVENMITHEELINLFMPENEAYQPKQFNEMFTGHLRLI